MYRPFIATVTGNFPADLPRAWAVVFLISGIFLWAAPVQAAQALRFAPLALLIFIRRSYDPQKKRRAWYQTAAVLLTCALLLLCDVDSGAEAGLAVLFLILCVSGIGAMTETTLSFAEKTAIGTPAIASALLAFALFFHMGKLNFIDFADFFGAALAAGALTWALRPKSGGKRK